jgi:uncharacterized protein
MSALEDLIKQIQADYPDKSPSLPPVDKWNPPLSGDMDLVIRRNGDWVHEGTVIARHELVRLFSSILKKEGDDYFLVTPVEKWRIQVEDVPFHVTTLEVVEKEGLQVLIFTTSTGDRVIAGPDNPLRVETSESGEPSPYILVRNGMEGLISRPVYYELAELAVTESEEKAAHGVYSLGEFYPLQ